MGQSAPLFQFPASEHSYFTWVKRPFFFFFSGILLINVFISYPLNKLNCILYLPIKLLMLLCTLLCVQRRFLLSPHNLAASCLLSPVASRLLPPSLHSRHTLPRMSHDVPASMPLHSLSPVLGPPASQSQRKLLSSKKAFLDHFPPCMPCIV